MQLKHTRDITFFMLPFYHLKEYYLVTLYLPKYDPVPKKRFQRKLIKTHKFYSNILK